MLFGKNKIAMLVAELLGGAILTLTTLAVLKSNLGFPLFIAACVGFAYGLLVMVLGALSGAHINPMVTLGLWILRKVSTAQALVYIAAQLLGSVAAARLFVYLTGQDLTNITAGDFAWRVLVAEIVGTFIFTFGVAAAVYQRQEGVRWAATAGGSLFLGILAASIASNGLLNPAIALGVQSVSRAYIAGPVIGAILGMSLYALLFKPAEPVAAKRAPAKKKR